MSLSKKKIALLREFVNFICEVCKKHEDVVGVLGPHRVVRGNVGGEYKIRNILMTCKDCHKNIHKNEFKHIVQ